MIKRAKHGVVFWISWGLVCMAPVFLAGLVFSPTFDPEIQVPGIPQSGDYDDATVVADDDDQSTAFNSLYFPPAGTSLASSQLGVFEEHSANKPLEVVRRNKGAVYPENAGVTIAGSTYPLRTYEPLLTPNDPHAQQSWTNTIKLPLAWDISTGDEDVVIAIIDTGFALGHEEFTDRWYKNSGEYGSTTLENPSVLNCTDQGMSLDQSCNLVDDDLDMIVDNESGVTSYENPSKLNCTDQGIPVDKSCNNIDDDNNGYVDDVTGWDFINQDSSVQAGQLNPGGEGTTHGTMVAGVAAATGNNGKGIAGVNWGARILPIQALDDDGYGDTVSVGNAIRYAVAQGAKVINISLGTAYHDPYVRQAIEGASRAGVVVVAASGNEGCNCVSYPAAYPEVVAVGALTSDGIPASFSSYGASLDIMAPGAGIRTTTWTAANQQSSYASSVSGTSFAAPIIAGLIATMRSTQTVAVPLQLIGGLGESTVRPTQMHQRSQDARYGFGVVDTQKALRRMTTAQSGVQAYSLSPVYAGTAFGSPYTDTAGGIRAQYCDTAVGTTPIYELRRTGSKLFTLSSTEARKAQSLGYTVSLFTYSCVNQPQDFYHLIRALDIHKEFYNDYTRY